MDDIQKKVCIVKDKDTGNAVTSALEALGGIDELVKKYSHVVIKPNLCGGVSGESGSHTSIKVLRSILEFFSSYSLPMFLAEADCSFNDANHMFRSLGVYELGKKFVAEVINLSKGPSVDIEVPRPNSIKNLRVSSVFSEGLIISVPVLKTHPWSGVTVSMKNMYGAVYQREKSMYHMGLEKNIVDINKAIGAHLSIVDATTAVVHGGFKYGLWVGCPPSQLDLIVAGYNFVSVDAVGTLILNRDPWSIGHIHLAAEQGMGTCNVKELNVISKGYTLPER